LGDIPNIQKWSKRFLIRIYPKGLRIESDNYNPLFYWFLGCQLVALNYQTPGYPMWLNEGKFMTSNRSGYIKKPTTLGVPPPSLRDTHIVSSAYLITIKVISAWRLPRPWSTESLYSSNYVSKPKVEVSLWDPYTVAYYHFNSDSKKKKEGGDSLFKDITLPQHHHLKYALLNYKIAVDKHKYKDTTILPYIQFKTYKTTEYTGGHSAIFTESKLKSDSFLVPQVNGDDSEDQKFICTDPHLDMVVFKVTDESITHSFSPLNRQINDIIGYYAITVNDIREGFRVVPLKGEHGAPLVHGDLLVYVSKKMI